MANKERVHTKELCQQLEWTSEGHQFSTDFIVLPVKGYDVVLRVQWLSALGPIIWDLSEMTMQFNYLGQCISLNGIHLRNYEVAAKKQSGKMF